MVEKKERGEGWIAARSVSFMPNGGGPQLHPKLHSGSKHESWDKRYGGNGCGHEGIDHCEVTERWCFQYRRSCNLRSFVWMVYVKGITSIVLSNGKVTLGLKGYSKEPLWNSMRFRVDRNGYHIAGRFSSLVRFFLPEGTVDGPHTPLGCLVSFR